MKRDKLYDAALIITIILSLFSSAGSAPKGKKLTIKEKAEVPPPQPKYHLVTNEVKRAAILERYANSLTNAPAKKINRNLRTPGR